MVYRPAAYILTVLCHVLLGKSQHRPAELVASEGTKLVTWPDAGYTHVQAAEAGLQLVEGERTRPLSHPHLIKNSPARWY